MIGTIRKHSGWLWWLVAGLTIISFVIFMGNGGTRNGGVRVGGLGTLYGQPVTPEQLTIAQHEFYLVYWMQHHEWPERSTLSKGEQDREIYERLILAAKIKDAGIHVSEEAQAVVANNFLAELGRELSRDGKAPDIHAFVDNVLTPEGLTLADFQRVLSDEVAIGQLEAVYGMSGALLSPQEASQRYDRENQEVSVQAVFFSATNYLAQIDTPPAAVSQFYTNYMASYRTKDQVQLNYVSYELSNYLATAELGYTNLTMDVNRYFNEHGLDSVPGAKTADEAKAKIRTGLLRQKAGQMAVEQARQFVDQLFKMDPVQEENLVTLAKSSGLTVHTTAPFTEEDGPAEFAAPADLVKIAFKLNPSSPYYKPIAGTDAIYVIGLAQQIPSYIPPLTQIYGRVARDYQYYQGALKARTAGTNFFFSAIVQMATGKTFGQVAMSASQTPVLLPPFSLSTQDLPELGNHAQLGLLKQAAFSTEAGHVSQFESTAEGGFVLHVQSYLPMNQTKKDADMPRFLAELRRSRQNEAFNRWMMMEENRELPNTPVRDELQNEKQSSPR